jgi:SAM-dependent methyltransferase
LEPKEYDQWYQTPRGRWIGKLEYRKLFEALNPRPEESILDIGCGTGFFTRCFARDQTGTVAGIDPDPNTIEYAIAHRADNETYAVGSGEDVPFPPNSFDFTVAVTSLCFVEDQIGVLQEMARVSKKKIAVGLLNRNSILWLQKGKGGGKGAYAGAHWHTRSEVIGLFNAAGLPHPNIKTALYFPSGSMPARLAESILPGSFYWGSFMLAVSISTEQENS